MKIFCSQKKSINISPSAYQISTLFMIGDRTPNRLHSHSHWPPSINTFAQKTFIWHFTEIPIISPMIAFKWLLSPRSKHKEESDEKRVKEKEHAVSFGRLLESCSFFVRFVVVFTFTDHDFSVYFILFFLRDELTAFSSPETIFFVLFFS